MDNKQIARVLRDTAQLLEIDGAIIGRYRRSPGCQRLEERQLKILCFETGRQP